MSKLSAVIRHEYATIVKQPSFWIVMVAIPLFIGAIIAAISFGNQASSDRIESLAKDIRNVAVVDDSGFVSKELVESSGQTYANISELEELKQEVASGERNGLVYYPNDLKDSKEYEVYVNGTDFSRVSSINSLGDTLLETSLYAPLGSADVIALAQNGAGSTLTSYENGEPSPGFNKYIVPGLFTAMFYLILLFSIGYILTSISEEKENRSMEMALTYLRPRTLILGKLFGVILVTLTQLLFFATIAVVAYFIALGLGNEALRLPAGIDLSNLVFEPTAILFGIGFLVIGFMLYAGLMAITAAALPARQANSFSAVFFIAGFSPFYFMNLILTDPENPVVRFVTFFPLTSPTTSLIRNTVGNLSLAEASLALGVMFASMLLAVWLAVRIFPKGALEFQNAISFKSIFYK